MKNLILKNQVLAKEYGIVENYPDSNVKKTIELEEKASSLMVDALLIENDEKSVPVERMGTLTNALFESNLLTFSDDCSNTENLFNEILFAKIKAHQPMMEKLIELFKKDKSIFENEKSFNIKFIDKMDTINHFEIIQITKENKDLVIVLQRQGQNKVINLSSYYFSEQQDPGVDAIKALTRGRTEFEVFSFNVFNKQNTIQSIDKTLETLNVLSRLSTIFNIK